MSDTSAHQPGRMQVGTVAGLIEAVEPMGDLDQFLIDDLTADEEDAFYRVLDEA
ncbi:MAG: hypothetical protein LC808_29370 [Actinobacteria bacterium]|nr:hypothetical protein [Actinomycetota bacterium]